jgi:hypothetical protein
MRRKIALAALLVLVTVTALALVVAPTAFAKAETMAFSGTEVFVASTPLSYTVTGGVAHMAFANVFYDTTSAHQEMLEGYTFTRLYAVATLVDGVPTDSVMRGTVHKDTAAGEWEGTFNGTMSMTDLTWDCKIRGRGISGDVTGMLMFGRNVKTAPGPFGVAILTGTVLAPHGF